MELFPYGACGDRLWVREAYWIHAPIHGTCYVRYRATEKSCPTKCRPSIYMPRWASRITLEITDVRVQQLQEISETDARAEGFEAEMVHGDTCDSQSFCDGHTCGAVDCSARNNFEITWDSLNSKRGYSWESNPWVWAITFKRVEK